MYVFIVLFFKLLYLKTVIIKGWGVTLYNYTQHDLNFILNVHQKKTGRKYIKMLTNIPNVRPERYGFLMKII